MKNVLSLLFIFLFSFIGSAQVLQPAKWSYDVSRDAVNIGEELDLLFRADVDRDWYLYSSDFDPDCGPMVTTFTFNKHSSFELVGDIKPIGAKKKFDEIFECEYTYFRKDALFRQTVKVLSENLIIAGSYEYQVCTDVDGKCIPFDDEFDFSKQIAVRSQLIHEEDKPFVTAPSTNTKEFEQIDDIKSGVDRLAIVITSEAVDSSKSSLKTYDIQTEEKEVSLWGFMVLAFLTG